MSWAELEHTSDTELQRHLAASREELRDIRFKVSQGQHKNVRQLRLLKHDIARLMTKIQQRASAQSKS